MITSGMTAQLINADRTKKIFHFIQSYSPIVEIVQQFLQTICHGFRMTSDSCRTHQIWHFLWKCLKKTHSIIHEKTAMPFEQCLFGALFPFSKTETRDSKRLLSQRSMATFLYLGDLVHTPVIMYTSYFTCTCR